MERSSVLGLDDMVVFLAVVEGGSFTAAAQRLGLRKSTVSRRVSALEARLGLELLHRTTRQLRLTGAGERYHGHCARVVAQARAAEEEVKEESVSPRGTLRLSATPLLADLLLPPVLGPFLARYPGVEVEVVTSWGLPRVLADGFDLAFSVGALADSTLRSRALGSARVAYCVSAAYLQAHGAPRTPQELGAHRCVALFGGEPQITWPFANSRGGTQWVPVAPRLRVNDFSLAYQAVLDGAGVARFPQPVVAEDVAAGRLCEVLTDWLPQPFPVRVVYPSNHRPPPKVQAFLELLTTYLQAHPGVLGKPHTPGPRRNRKVG